MGGGPGVARMSGEFRGFCADEIGVKAIFALVAFACFAVMFVVALIATKGSECRHEVVGDDPEA